MTQQQAHAYFEDYAAAVMGDAEHAIDRFLNMPFTVVRRDGATALTDRAAMMENFKQVNEINEQIGLERAIITSCDVTPTPADNVVETAIGWRFENKAGDPLYAFETRYLLCDYGDGWKITVAIDVDN